MDRKFERKAPAPISRPPAACLQQKPLPLDAARPLLNIAASKPARRKKPPQPASSSKPSRTRVRARLPAKSGTSGVPHMPQKQSSQQQAGQGHPSWVPSGGTGGTRWNTHPPSLLSRSPKNTLYCKRFIFVSANPFNPCSWLLPGCMFQNQQSQKVALQ